MLTTGLIFSRIIQHSQPALSFAVSWRSCIDFPDCRLFMRFNYLAIDSELETLRKYHRSSVCWYSSTTLTKYWRVLPEVVQLLLLRSTPVLEYHYWSTGVRSTTGLLLEYRSRSTSTHVVTITLVVLTVTISTKFVLTVIGSLTDGDT